MQQRGARPLAANHGTRSLARRLNQIKVLGEDTGLIQATESFGDHLQSVVQRPSISRESAGPSERASTALVGSDAARRLVSHTGIEPAPANASYRQANLRMSSRKWYAGGATNYSHLSDQRQRSRARSYGSFSPGGGTRLEGVLLYLDAE
jgi:hypothetical protein